MKRTMDCAYLALFVLGLIQILSPQLEAQNRDWNRNNQPREGVCFYTDANYEGEVFCASSGESQQNVGEYYNDRFSSIRIFGRAELTVYEDKNFGGESRTYSQDTPHLGDWNDRITSFQVTGGRRYGEQYGGRGSGNEPRHGVCFYTDANYGGEVFCASSGESQRNVEEHYNDRFSSIRIFGRAEVTVYEDKNFGGASRTFSQDTPHLGDWNDRITSFQVTGGRNYGEQYGGQGSGNEPRNGACFYTDADYRGDNFCMNAGENLRNLGDRFNDKVSSIRVFGRARVVVYENERFGGASKTFASDVSHLGNFNDKISSIEVK